MPVHNSTTQSIGHVTLNPQTPIVAGTYGTWVLTYTIGSYGIDSGGQIKIARRLVSDWGNPQFDSPQAEGYSTVKTNGAAKLRASWQPIGYIRPKSRAIVIDVYDGSLSPGETVTITLGDTSQGSPGLRAQTYLESHFEFLMLVDPTNSTDPRPLAESPTVAIIADEMQHLVCLLPSQLPVGNSVEIFVKGEDRWRNPTPAPNLVDFEWVGTGDVEINNRMLTALTIGEGYLKAKSTDGKFTGRSNPLVIYEALPNVQRYWGDLHAQTGETVGVGSEDEYFSFGRDWGYLDFISHQGNDFQISDAYWQHLNATTKKYHQDHQFVVFPGYEWSASSPTGGDHNVFYRGEGQPILRSSHWLVPNTPETALSPAHPADQFYRKLKQAVPSNDVIVCMHVGGRYANMRDYFDQDLIALVELVSCWGVFEWMLWDAFDKGYIVGVMCNSDGHHGRPGAEGAGMAEFGIESGLTCVLSDGLTRDSVFDALKARNCYGTTGARMHLDFSAGEHRMGTIVTALAESVTLQAAITGTGPLESLQLFCGKAVIREIRPPEFQQLTQSNYIRISWQGCRERGRQRRVTWDGELRTQGCSIQSAALFSFDTISDGIIEQTAHRIVFGSKTTGDRDGFDLLFDDASQGNLIFDSAAGQIILDLAELTDETPRRTYDFGGVDMQVIIERYPAKVATLSLTLTETVIPPADNLTPYFIKATQVDGEMAWASPIYFDLR